MSTYVSINIEMLFDYSNLLVFYRISCYLEEILAVDE